MTKPRKELKPSDLIALRDSREKRPLDLELKCETATLATGDYTLKGLEGSICIERKELSDLLNCVGRDRERFDRELQRMQAYQTKVIVIEASRATVELKQYRSSVHPNAVMASTYAWMARGITVEWAGDRFQAAKIVSRILFYAARDRWRELSSFYDSLQLVTKEDKSA